MRAAGRLGRDRLCRRTYLACVPDRDVNDSWADYVRRRMRERGITGPSALAKRSGVDQSVISRWLNEGRTPQVEQLRKVAEPLGTDLRALLIAAGYASEQDLPQGAPVPTRDDGRDHRPVGPEVQPEAEEILFRLPPGLTPRQRERARRIAEASLRGYLDDLEEE